MRTFIDGRNGIEGLAGLGFDCTVFPDGHDDLRSRVDRFARFLDAMRAREPEAFPIATLGYSAGGLVNRGFLRAYPHRAHEIAATVQVGAPNGGLITRYAALTMKLAFLPNHVLADMDVESDFMYWLNDSGGKWVKTGTTRARSGGSSTAIHGSRRPDTGCCRSADACRSITCRATASS